MFDIFDDDEDLQQIAQLRAQKTGSETGDALSAMGSLFGNLAGMIGKIQKEGEQKAFKEDISGALKDMSNPKMSVGDSLKRLAEIADKHPKVSGSLISGLTNTMLSVKQEAEKDARLGNVARLMGDALAKGKSSEETIDIFSKSLKNVRGVTPEHILNIGEAARANLIQKESIASGRRGEERTEGEIAFRSSQQEVDRQKKLLSVDMFGTTNLSDEQKAQLETETTRQGIMPKTEEEALSQLRGEGGAIRQDISTRALLNNAKRGPQAMEASRQVMAGSNLFDEIQRRVFTDADTPEKLNKARKDLTQFISQFKSTDNPKGEVFPGTGKVFKQANEVIQEFVMGGGDPREINLTIAGVTRQETPLRDFTVKEAGKAVQAGLDASKAEKQVLPFAEKQTLFFKAKRAMGINAKKIPIPEKQADKIARLKELQAAGTITPGAAKPERFLTPAGTSVLQEAVESQGLKMTEVIKALQSYAEVRQGVLDLTPVKSRQDALAIIQALKSQGLLR